jgi:diguanylate cyclase (GGDEF)-like protein
MLRRTVQRPEPAAKPVSAMTPVFPIAWLAAGLIVMAILIAVASTFTFSAQARLQSLAGPNGNSLYDEINWYLSASMFIRFAALGLVIGGGLIVLRGARRLEAARVAAEACAAELREQKRELKLLNQRLFDEARIDPLTKLQTRLRLSEDLEELWANTERHGDHYCAIMCDVDRFKEFNDLYGHVAGDDVLRRVAGALLLGCRVGDHLYRYGGEEFLLLIRVASAIDALSIADRHRAAVEALAVDHEANGPGVVTVSMGLAPLWAGTYTDATAWINQADAALYRAKRSGRNCIAAVGAEDLMLAA